MGNSSHLPKTIAVDGPASSGKSSISYAIAQQLNYVFVDTGAFYRAITVLTLEQHIDPANTEQITQIAQQAQLDITAETAADGRQYTVFANGRDITPQLNSPAVDANVSAISAIAGVRAALLDAQRQIAERRAVIMAGRDIGTVVLPNADLKIYITASLEKRAQRRCQQRNTAGETTDLEMIREGLRQRDALDSGRDVAPLLKAADAIALDTSDMTFDEAVQAMHRIIQDWGEDRAADSPAP